MNPTRRNLLAGSGMLVSVAALRGASPVLAEQVKPPPKTKKTDRARDPFEQLAHQRAGERNPYVDIRDYGTVTDGGDITAALQGALDDVNLNGQNARVRVPMVGQGIYTCDAITFPNFDPLILELDCTQITTSATWSFTNSNGGTTIRGMQHGTQGSVYPYGPVPRPRLIGASGVDPVINVRANNFWIEGLTIIGTHGKGLNVLGVALVTVKHCAIGTSSNSRSGNLPAMKFDSVFWAQLDNLLLEPGINSGGAVAGYSAEFTTDTNVGPNNGIMLCKDWIINRNGILFRSVFGPAGVNHTEMIDLHSENQVPGTSLLTFDSTANALGYMKFVRCSISDSAGEASYIIKNIGSNTNGIRIESANNVRLIDPTSTHPITNLVIDNTVPSPTTGHMNQSFASLYAGTENHALWRQETPGAIDAMLMTAPVGLPWVVATPINVNQDGSTWTAVSGATITTGLPAPDGSNLAVGVSGGGGARIYNVNHTLAAGDWFIAGMWVYNPSGGGVNTAGIGVELISNPSPTLINSGASGGLFNGALENRITDNGWRWCCGAYKVTTLGTNPVGVRLIVSSSERHYFNPCLMLFSAASNPYDDATMVNLARSLKGGWSPTAVVGDVSILDHQVFKAGVFKATAKTFATLPSPPVAGMQAYITDCNTANWGATAVGGGSSKVMVWYNGSNWTVVGK